MRKIKLAIAGIGNCASNLVQGIEYYKSNQRSEGLMNRVAGGYDVTDIEVVAAFDIAQGKVGKDLSEAIFAPPNCTKMIANVPISGVVVQKGPIYDGWDKLFEGKVTVSDKEPSDISAVLKESGADVLLITLPTGSVDAAHAYAIAALKFGINVVNGIPVMLTHEEDVVAEAVNNRACIIGDDFKSQIGGTILHNALLRLFQKRGVNIKNTYQINYGGNMDFYNLQTVRGQEKHKSKARGIISGYEEPIDISINVSYVENQGDNKTCKILIEGTNFGGCPITLDCTMTVVDSANSSGVIVEAVRLARIAQEKGIFGRLDAPSAFFMKSPARQMDDDLAIREIEDLVKA